MNKGKDRRPVSVEDLLRLKRSEQPNRDFWVDWHAELSSKLAEEAKHKPSWISRSLPRFWVAVARWQMPVGVTALAALAFIVAREYNPPLPALSAPALGSVPSQEAVSPEAVSQPSPLSELRAASTVQKHDSSSGQVASSMLGLTDKSQSAESPVAITIAANLAQARTMDASFGSVAYTLHGKDSLPADEPLTRIAYNRDARRERLLDVYQTSFAPSVPAAAKLLDRSPSRLSEDELTENITRRMIQAKGDKLSLRF